MGKYSFKLLVDRLNAVNGDKLHLLRVPSFCFQLLDLERLNDVEYLDQLDKAALLDELVECEAVKLFAGN
jgi:hypothetical protein